MKNMKAYSLLLFLLCCNRAFSQDTAVVLTLDAFFAQIIRNHPVAKQAHLINEQARQQLRLARAAFDPSIKGDFNQKQYDGKTYYTQTDANIIWPSWFGAEFKAGLENNSGLYLNPQENVPPNGLYNAGVSVPVLQGFMFDTRRAALAQAKIMLRYSEAEQQQALNKLLFEATKVYAEWYKAYFVLLIKREGLENADNNLVAIRRRAQEGDLPWIDTTEAYTERQRRRLDVSQSVAYYNNSRNMVAQYLWDENINPVFLRPEVIPQSSFNINIPAEKNLNDLNRFISANFYFQQLNFKLQHLEIDQRLWRENTKPAISIQYNYLFPVDRYLEAPFVAQGYKWGIQMNMPITWRKELSKRRIASIKVEDARFEVKNFENTLRTEIANSENLVRNINQLIVLQNDIVSGTEKLQQAERQRFGMGESTFFILNMRENKLLDEKQKNISLKAELLKQNAQYLYLLGDLTDEFVKE